MEKGLKKIETGAIGGEFTYCFTPTGLGTIIRVTRLNEEINLTNYDEW